MSEETKRLSSQALTRLQQMVPVSISSAAREGTSNLFLSALKSLDRSQLADYVEECRFQQGDVIFTEGDIGDAMYLIWSGKLAVVKGPLSDPVEVLHRGPGDTVGEMALLNKKPRSASLVVLEVARLLRVAHDRMREMILKNPTIGINMLSQLSERLRQARNDSSINRKQNRALLSQLSELRDENARLVSLDQARQETIDLIIHDLRNPLANMNIVLQMLDVMLPADVLSENRDLLDIARAANGRMQRLVDSLLDMRRIENGMLEPDISFVSLPHLIDLVLQENQFGLERRHIHVDVTVPESLPPIPLDEILIGRVLHNLMDNAVKHMPEGGHLEINVVPQGDVIQIHVCDDGPGIDPENRELIFERFSQVSADKERKYGFGLGLAFCRQAVEAHNGRIWVEPKEAESGSRFVFTLPVEHQ